MYYIHNEEQKRQYENIMEELKDQQYRLRWSEKRCKIGIKESIKQSLRKRFGEVSGKTVLEKMPARKREKADYFSNEKIAVYTCITGSYDTLREPVFVPDNCDFWAITDQEVPNDSYWKKIDISEVRQIADMKDPVLMNRYIKMNPYEIFSGYRYSIYLDANFRIITDITEEINRISKQGIAFFDHGVRKGVYEEIEECIRLGKADEKELRAAEEFLKKNNMPKGYGLLLGGIIARDHQNKVGKQISEEWWELYRKFPLRDQILLPYVLYRRNILVKEIATLGDNVKSAYGIERCRHIRSNGNEI